MYDYIDPEIIGLKGQLPAPVLQAESRGESSREALAHLTAEELNRALRINQKLIARHEQRLADLEDELESRRSPALPPEQVRTRDV